MGGADPDKEFVDVYMNAIKHKTNDSFRKRNNAHVYQAISQ